jgi:drug/metabolite transporter (DMT)-like permease
MKPTGIIGIILVVVGIAMLAYGGYTSFTTTENVAKLGPLEINKEEKHPVPIGPIVGGVCIVGGVLLLVTGRKAV